MECESRDDKNKKLSIEVNKVRPYLSNMINDLKLQGQWKIQLSIAINFFSSKDTKKTCAMHLKSNSIEIMIGNKTDEIIEDIFDSLLQKHQIDLKESTKGSKFVLDDIDVLPYRYRKMNLNLL